MAFDSVTQIKDHLTDLRSERAKVRSPCKIFFDRRVDEEVQGIASYTKHACKTELTRPNLVFVPRSMVRSVPGNQQPTNYLLRIVLRYHPCQKHVIRLRGRSAELLEGNHVKVYIF